MTAKALTILPGVASGSAKCTLSNPNGYRNVE